MTRTLSVFPVDGHGCDFRIALWAGVLRGVRFFEVAQRLWSVVFLYDAENRRTSAVINNGGASTYVYDGDGRRVQMTTSTGTTTFVYDADLFPFASVVEIPQARLPEALGQSLVVTAITNDAALRQRLLSSNLVGRLNLGAIPTGQISWDQPHEGNLFDHLYARRAFQAA
jgi:YD repeat-containing protein